MSITLTALQKQRRDTAANWTSANPTLLAGEIGIESDTNKIKIGNGSTAWISLAYTPWSQLSAYPIVNADISATAEIAVSKLADGTARQLLQTDAAGTGVEWASNIDIPGTLDVTGAATFDNNVTVQGDLTVNGTTTTIDTTNLAIEDKNIEIGKVATPTDVTADGGGITLKGTTDKTISWIDSTDAWTFSEHVNIASAKEYRINGTKVLDGTSLGSGVVSSSLTSVGTIGTGTWQGTAINKTYLDSTLVSTGDTGTVTSTMIADGTIVNGDINASAAIADTKLGTISTAGKVSNSATTATSSNTNNAIVARDGSGNFSAGTITANLAGNASTVTTNANLTGDVTSVGNATSIATGVIVDADINASAAIAYSKLAALNSGNILVGSSGNVATSTAVTGDVTISNAGVTAIASGVIVDADVNASAAIAFSKLANVSATDKLLGRSSAGAGAIEEITCTAAGRALLDDANAAAQRTTLGIDGPAFSAYQASGSANTLSPATWTKITFNVELFDTDSCYDTSTSTFTPNKAGYYLITAAVTHQGDATAFSTAAALYLNGAQKDRFCQVHSALNAGIQGSGTLLYYANGTTDYFEVYVNHGAATSKNTVPGPATGNQVYWHAHFVKP